MERFEIYLAWLSHLYVNTMNIIHYMHDKYAYEKIQMALHDTEVERFMAFGIAGFSVVADSLSAIKYANVKPVKNEDGFITELVFGKKELPELFSVILPKLKESIEFKDIDENEIQKQSGVAGKKRQSLEPMCKTQREYAEGKQKFQGLSWWAIVIRLQGGDRELESNEDRERRENGLIPRVMRALHA